MTTAEPRFRLNPRLRDARQAHPEQPPQSVLARQASARGVTSLTAAVISRIELGYRDASWAEIAVLAEALGVGAEWLAGTSPVRHPTPAVPEPAEPPAPPPEPPQKQEPVAPLVQDSRLPPEKPPIEDQPTVHLKRRRLAQEIDRANAAIADRSLPPAIWRAWRGYLDQVRTALQNTSDV